MHTKRLIHVLLLCVVLVVFVPLYEHVTAQPAHAATSNTYYVDADEGSDSCDGLAPTPPPAPDCPWQTVARVNSMTFQPGDTIAFEDTETWTDTINNNPYYLHPLGSGTSTAPITLTDYCPTTGQVGGCSTPLAYPMLNGNGDGSAVGGAGNPGGTLYLDNQQFWTISHLEIQNYCQSTCSPGYRQGILIRAQDVGSPGPNAVNGITLQNLTVDSVTGETGYTLEAKRTGGIIFDIEGTTTPTYFNAVTISNVTVHDVSRSGIYFYSTWKGPVTETPIIYPCPMNDDYRAGVWVPSTNVVVSNNTVYNVAGDGIVVTDSIEQRITFNVVHDTHLDGDFSAGIWSEDSFDATIADNEVYRVLFNGGSNDNHGANDAEAFDSDRCDIGAIFEYNYSHENDGGFLLTIPYSADTIVRYNISQNDGNDVFDSRYFLMNNTEGGLQLYDNDIYTNLKTTGLIANSGLSYTNSPQPLFENNLVVNQNPAGVCFINTQGSTGWLVSNNDVYGYSPPCSYSNPISGNPEFSSPPAGTGRASAITAYTLASSNPAFCQGTSIPNNGSYDFAGTPLPAGAVDAGALEKGANIC